jgi:two-component system, NtrC family, sensor histidine kinase HupT/HoxJ
MAAMMETDVEAPRDLTTTVTRTHDDKLSDLGTRITRVAHEINVPLSLICGSLDTLGQYADALVQFVEAMATQTLCDAETRRLRHQLNIDYVAHNTLPLLDICREGTQRLAHIVQELRGYTRRDGGVKVRVDLEQLLRDAVRLVACGRDRLPRIHVDLASLQGVATSPAALSQAFVNLIANAFDAAANAADPQVWLCASPSTHASTAFVEIHVRDNGPGIAPELQQRIFEPFFTTKPSSRGLGLGLAITKEIIEAHGGSIEVVDGIGAGATFAIRLPCDL